MVLRPRSSDIAVSTPRGLLNARYTTSWRAGMRLPSTRMIWVSGSTRAPNRRTTCPSTSTRPAPISSSQCRLLPTPAAAGYVGKVVALALVGGEVVIVFEAHAAQRPEPGVRLG